VIYDPDDPREQIHNKLLAARAKAAEANIARREAEQAERADPATIAEFDRLVAERVAQEIQPPPPLVDHIQLPDWPTDILPDWIVDHITATSERLQVPVDLCAQLAVGVLSSICMGHIRTHCHDWDEPGNLYLYCAMHSGAGKSPAEKAVVGPLREWEKRQREDTDDDYKIALAEHRVAVKRARELEAQHAKGACDVSEFREAAIEAGKPQPAPFRLTVDDATPERLTQLLASHGQLAMISTEAGLLDMVAGGYSSNGQANLDVYLKSWSGETIQRDRKGSDSGPEQTIVDDPLLTIALTIQPSVIETYQASRRDLVGRGFFARFMPSVPDSLVGLRTYERRPGAGPEAVRYATTISELATTFNAIDEIVDYRLDDAAADLFLTWVANMEPDLAPGGRLEALHDQSAKIKSSVLRFAGILTAVTDGNLAVPAQTVAAAIRLGDYWVAHAMAVEGVVEAVDGTDSHAVKVAVDILDWSRKRQAETWTPREVWRSLRRSYQYVEDLLPGLDVLVANVWVDLIEGTLDDIGHRGVRVLCRTHPVALTRSVRELTHSGRTTPRTCTALEEGISPPPPPQIEPTGPQPPQGVREPSSVAVLPDDHDEPVELTEEDLGIFY